MLKEEIIPATFSREKNSERASKKKEKRKSGAEAL